MPCHNVHMNDLSYLFVPREDCAILVVPSYVPSTLVEYGNVSSDEMRCIAFAYQSSLVAFRDVRAVVYVRIAVYADS